MINTYIIGTGFLSENLKKKITRSEVYSAKNFIENINSINKRNNKINIIINSFFTTQKLSNIDSYELFANKSIFEISKILDLLDSKIVNKVIYTSSSSVYGSISNNIELIDDNNRSMYAGFKISSEFQIKNYCNKNNIPLNICRVFNLYGKNNKFSIIEKLKNAKISNNKLNIYNNGLSFRDFVHIDDVVKIYQYILNKIPHSGLYDIGTGKGICVKEIINKLNIRKNNIIYKRKKINELSESIADNFELIKKIKNFKFKKLEDYLGIKKELKFKKISKKNNIENNISGSIIYGAGYSGRKIVKIMSSYDRNHISYFVDDDLSKIGTYIENIKVISFDELKIISHNSNIRNIIIAIPSLDLSKRSKLIRKVVPYCETISTLPEKSFYKNSPIELIDINDISFDELFGKETVKVEYPIINKFKKYRILITGGAGSIGTEIVKQLAKSNPKEIIVLDHSELNIYRISKILKNNKIKLILGDIKDENFVKNLIDKYSIDYIFHTAAYKHVKFLEENVHSAFKNNIIGTYNLLNAIKGKRIKFIFISTDKAVNPKNILGITKRIGEILVQTTFAKSDYQNSNYLILRFGNVIGSDGSALPLFLTQIKNNEPISLTHKNMRRYFMSIKEACNLVLQSSVSKHKDKIFFLDMGKPIKILDIIKRMFKVYANNDQKLKIKIIGNTFNEKLTEKLFYKRKVFKTSIKKVFYINDDIYNKNKFLEKLIQIISNINSINNNKLQNSLKNLLKTK